MINLLSLQPKSEFKFQQTVLNLFFKKQETQLSCCLRFTADTALRTWNVISQLKKRKNN